MTATVGIWNIALTVVILGGIVTAVTVVAACFWMLERERKNRPLLPFGARMRVERAKARTEVLGEELKAEAIEVKRLAVSHQRTRVMAAMEKDDDETVMRLGLPPAAQEPEDGEWREKPPPSNPPLSYPPSYYR